VLEGTNLNPSEELKTMSQAEAQTIPTISTRRGTKQTCTNEDCGRRFYDLKKEPADCPYCGAAVEAHVVLRHEFQMLGKRPKGKTYRLDAPPPVAEAEDTAAETEVDEEEEDATPSTAADLLIEVDDEADDTTADVVGQDRNTDEAS
jgi:uncharacterized protein (TIGR02300 family)